MTTRRIQSHHCAAWLLAVLMATAQSLAGPVPGGFGKKKEEPKKDGDRQGLSTAPNEMLEFAVDAKSKRNQVVFLSKAPKETIKGISRTVTGHLKGNLYALSDIEGSFEVAWKDLDTGNKMRNEHMISSPWVDSASHPAILFTLTGIEPDDKQPKSGKVLKCVLVGKMAMNGQEKEIKVPSTIAYLPAGKSKSAKKAGAHVSIKSKFDVELSDYGINGMGIGQKVAKTQNITVSLVMQSEKKEAPKTADSKKKNSKKKKKSDSEA